MKKLTIQEVINDIRKIISAHTDLIKVIGIFGSLAHEDEHDGSNIDLMVEYNSLQEFSMEPFTKFCELCNQLEEQLAKIYKRKVDIVHIENGSLDNLFDETVINEVVWL